MIRKFLKSQNHVGRTPTKVDERPRKKGGEFVKEIGSTSHIAEWLNQTGEVISQKFNKNRFSWGENAPEVC